ncbi:hypothetical protein BMS3Abin04_00752 [bacterium BMS3Abin04]|nr:hypothetical protein BMS3Abin04_00752 [bacterium BMS3Abin04]
MRFFVIPQKNMKNKFISISIILIAVFTSGCLRTYFPAVYESSAAPMVFETNNSDSIRSKYVSADLTISKGSYKNESLYLLRGSYIIANTADHINTNLKLFGYSGIYKVAGLGKYNGGKSLFGLGTDLGFNINFKINKFKVGIGLSAGFGAELGGYYNFRKSANRENLIDSKIGLFYVSLTAFPIFAYEFSESTILSAQINIGFPGILSPSIVLNNNDQVYWLSYMPNYDSRDKSIGRRIVLGFMINLNKLKFAL